jgi:hypothetical protein
VTDAVEIQVQEDGSMVPVAARDWQSTLYDAASIRLLGQVDDDDDIWDVYEVTHRDGQVRTYAIEVGAEPASPTGPGPVKGGKA